MDRPDYYARLGHDGPPAPDALGNPPLWETNLVTGDPLTRCPMRDLLACDAEEPGAGRELQRMRTIYHPLWTKGHLLAEGGASAQPARYVDWMQTLDALTATSERKYREVRGVGAPPAATPDGDD